MSGIQKTISVQNNTNRADLHRPDFEAILQQKGRDVVLEKALQCPCKSKDANQQSNCQNCGGSGWIFINAKSTRMILQAMSYTPDYKAWSQEITGDLKITASDSEELTFMDRITVTNAKAYFTEVLFFKKKGNVTFAYTAYDISEIKYIGYFQGTTQTLKKLALDVDYVFERNIIKLINPALVAVQGFISCSIRYCYSPVYHISEMKRESMESYELQGTEKLIHLPVSGIARQGHIMFTASNLNGDRLLDNSYAEVPLPTNCGC